MDQNETPKITFNEEELQHPARASYSDTPKIVYWVMKYSGGLIKDERRANYVLVGFILLAITVSLFLSFGGGHTQRKLTPIQIEQMRQEQVKLFPAPN